MKSMTKIATPATNTDIFIDFTPSKEQIDTLAHRLMPEIKKYFASEQTQRDFEKWKEMQKMA